MRRATNFDKLTRPRKGKLQGSTDAWLPHVCGSGAIAEPLSERAGVCFDCEVLMILMVLVLTVLICPWHYLIMTRDRIRGNCCRRFYEPA